jgi:pimeloyl-ACP methyl ester carboxylesterase
VTGRLRGCTVTTGGQAYTDTGTRREPAVLLVHGWGADARTWSMLGPLLAVNHRVLTVDVRGHGRSPIPSDAPDRLDPEVIAGDLVAVLDVTGVERVIAVGHSWGGQLVTALAVTRPDRVAGLVVLDPAYGAESEAELLAMRDRWYSPDARAALRDFAEGAFSAKTPEPVRERVRAGFRDADVQVLADAFVAMYLTDRSFGLRDATEPYLGRVAAPTLAVYSSETAADWARRLPAPDGSRVVAWPGAGHYLHEERPAELARLIDGWLE